MAPPVGRGYTKKRSILSLMVFLVLGGLLPVINQFGDLSSALAVTTTWAKTYGGPENEFSSFVQETSEGGYIVAGSFGDGAWLIKLDSAGSIEWDEVYGGGGASSVQQTADDGFIVAGSSSAFGPGSVDAWIFKVDSAGNLEWQKTYGEDFQFDKASSAEQTSDGGYIVSLRTGGLDFANLGVLKLDSEGGIEWEKTFGHETHIAFSVPRSSSAQQTLDGGYIVSASTSISGNTDLLLMKLESDGDVEWERAYGGPFGDNGGLVQQTSDGGYVAAGLTGSFAGVDGGIDIWIVKVDSGGDVEWEKAYGGATAAGFAKAIQQTSDEGYVVTGTTGDASSLLEHAWLIKLDPDGSIEWEKTIGDGGHVATDSVQETSDGGFVVSGSTDLVGAGAFDLLVLKLASDGSIESCDVGLVGENDETVSDTSASVTDTAAGVTDTTFTVRNTDSTVHDSSSVVHDFCDPDSYSLNLFENTGEHSDGVVVLNQDIRAVATTTDSSVDQVRFRWTDTFGNLAREMTVPISAGEDTLAPEELGAWEVIADFLDGSTIRKRLDLEFSTVPVAPTPVNWDGGGDGTSWSDCLNWVGDECPTGPNIITIGPGSVVELDIDFVISTGARLVVDSGAEMTILSGVEFTDDLLEGGEIQNSGLINHLGDLIELNSISNLGVFNNDGDVFTIGIFNNTLAGLVNNDGNIGSCGQAVNTGAIKNNVGATFAVVCASGFSNTGTFDNLGTLGTDQETFISNSGVLNNFGTLENEHDSQLENTGTLNNTAGATIINGPGASIINHGSFINHGVIHNSGQILNSCGSSFDNTGIVEGDPVETDPCADYELKLFENSVEPSDGEVNMEQEVRAVVSTTDSAVKSIVFKWFNPAGELTREVTVPMDIGEDTYAPNEPGDWLVVANFGTGQDVVQHLTVQFFVLPESPVGAIAIVLSSLMVLVAFNRLGRKRSIDD